MYVVPEETLKTLKCSSCGNYLSFFPISLTKDQSMICGRCSVPEEQLLIRNDMYEILASLMHFPCRYFSYGCGAHLLPEDIPAHEECCQYKPSKCPTSFFTTCLWEGSRLCQHCWQSHSDKIINVGHEFEIEYIENKGCKLFEHHSMVYFFIYEFNSYDGSLDVSVIILQKDNVSRSVFILNISGDIGHLRLQCSPVSTSVNDINKHEYSHRLFYKCLNSNQENIFRIKIEITHADDAISLSVSAPPPIDFKTWSKLICMQCEMYSELLFHKHDGTYCKDCIKYSSTNYNDYYYDDVIDVSSSIDQGIHEKKAIFGCKFSCNGCTFSDDNISELNDHFVVCQYESKKCPVEDVACKKLIVARSLDFHLGLGHSTTTCGQKIDFASTDHTITNFGDQWYLLRWKKTDKGCVWKIKLLTPISNPDTIRIGIFVESGNQRIMLSGLLDDLEEKSVLELSLLKSFFENQQNFEKTLEFKYYISKFKPC